MRNKSIEELVISAARGEPMDVNERARLETSLEGSRQRELTADLGRLRRALRDVRAPIDGEDALRAAFRARRARHTRPRPWKYVAGSAAAAGLIGLVAAWIGFGPPAPLDERRAREAPRASAEAALPGTVGASAAGSAPLVPVAGAFQPLMYAPGFTPTGSYSVVRVRIPISSLALSYGTDLDGVVEADILIGEDGLPTAIRFSQTDALASTVSQ